MQATLGRSLTRPRHLLATAALILIMGGSGWGLAGAAAADAAEPSGISLGSDAITSFSLPLPKVGDAGHYELRRAELSPDASYRGFKADRSLTFDFEVEASTYQYDASGQPHWTHVVRGNRNESGRDEIQREFLDAKSRDLVAAQWSHGSIEPSRASQTLTGQAYETRSMTWGGLYFGGTSLLPCGFWNPYQGHGPAIEGKLRRITEECRDGPGPNNPNAWWRLVRGASNSTPVVLQEDWYSTNPINRPSFVHPADVSMFYRADLPYPIEVLDVTGGFVGAPGDRFTLTAFQGGSSPLVAQGPQPVPAPLPATRMAPRTAVLFDDAGVDQAFPLSAAYRYVLADATHADVSTFMKSHPKAYLTWARYAEFYMDGNHAMRWTFMMTDGTDQIRTAIARDVPYAAGPVPSLASSTPTYRYEDASRSMGPHEWDHVRWATMDRLPANLPTVASLWAQASILSGPFNASASPGWEFQFNCKEADCTEVMYEISAGQYLYTRTTGPLYPAVDNRVDKWDMRYTDFRDGSLDSTTMTTQEDVRQQAPPAPIPAPKGDPTPEVQALSAMPAWVLPGPATAAGIGFGALFIGVLYWLWPAVRFAGFGLFSRVSQDRILDNPVRSQIVAAVQAQPGIHHQALVRIIGKGHGAMEHHLAKLVEANQLIRHEGARYTCYFPAHGTDRAVVSAAPLLKSKVARAVLVASRSETHPSLTELAQTLGVSTPTVHYHATRLSTAGLMASAEGGREVRYVATPLGERVLAGMDVA
jgi:predicted transcriptional regulator